MRILLALAAALLATATSAAGLPDREANVILASGMLVTVERAIFFDDGGLITLQLRNGGYEVARPRIRVVVFDERGQLKGTVVYCAGIVQPGTRQPVVIPLEVKGASTHDRFVAFVEEVLTPRKSYRLRESLGATLSQAQNAADLHGWDLTLTETPRSGEIPACPCECGESQRVAESACQDGLTAFTCTPMAPGCSQGATCGR
jgi:hypothetical protein